MTGTKGKAPRFLEEPWNVRGREPLPAQTSLRVFGDPLVDHRLKILAVHSQCDGQIQQSAVLADNERLGCSRCLHNPILPHMPAFVNNYVQQS